MVGYCSVRAGGAATETRRIWSIACRGRRLHRKYWQSHWQPFSHNDLHASGPRMAACSVLPPFVIVKPAPFCFFLDIGVFLLSMRTLHFILFLYIIEVGFFAPDTKTVQTSSNLTDLVLDQPTCYVYLPCILVVGVAVYLRIR